MEKFLVVGAGSIGGLLGARLASRCGKDVTLVARGQHLAAMEKQGGLKLISPDGTEELCSNVKLAEKLSSLGVFDVIFLAVKSHQIEPIAHEIEPLCHEKTIIVPLQNGVPWWYFFKEGSEYEDARLKSIDRSGKLHKYIKSERVVGCIAFPAAEIVEPGVIKHVEGRGFPLGEPDRSTSDRAVTLSRILEEAGFKAPVRTDFREEIWLKLMGNICFNPISALSRATVSEIIQFPPSRELCLEAMKEIELVAAKLNCKMRVSAKRRIKRAQELAGDHKTSMLQDLEKGKQVEVDILTAVVEIAEMVEVAIPVIKSLTASTLLLNQVLGKRSKL